MAIGFPSLKRERQKGFSLIELSVIISTMAASAIGYLSWTQPENITDAKKAIVTRERIEKIENAIQAFRVEKGRLPCPADPYMRIDNTRTASPTDFYVNDFGIEDLDTTQTTINGVLTLGVDCADTQGAVPVHSLGLGNNYIEDAWGRRFTYKVSPNLCGADGGTTPGIGLSTEASRQKGCTRMDYASNTGNLTVTDGTTNKSTTAAYVIVSHGANGKGAFLPSGTKLADSADASELENSDVDTTFVQKSKDGNYDDITGFKTKVQLERLTSNATEKQVSVADCEANSQALKDIVLSNASSMTSFITGYERTAIYNQGEQVGLGLMMGLQNICVSYYGGNAATVNNQTWSGAQCPGNNNPATNGTSYASNYNVCTCDTGLWDGSCKANWAVANGLPYSTNLKLWLDAYTPESIYSDSGCTTLASTGQTVGCWKDLSGNGQNMVQITPANEPNYLAAGINGKNTVDFNGTSQSMNTSATFNLSATGAITTFVVNQNDTISMTNGFLRIILELSENFNSYADTWWLGYYRDDGNSMNGLGSMIKGNIGYVLQSHDVFYTAPTILRFEFDTAQTGASEIKSYVNGSLVSYDEVYADSNNSNVFGNRTLYLGARTSTGSYFDGDMGEILLYTAILSAANATLVENYLGDKWGIYVLPTSDQPSLWVDANDPQTLFTDSTCATAAVTGNTIGCWRDKAQYSLNAVQTNSAKEPLYTATSINGKNTVDFNGTTGSMNTSATMNLSATNKVTVFIAHHNDAVLAPDTMRDFIELSSDYGLVTDGFRVSYLKSGSFDGLYTALKGNGSGGGGWNGVSHNTYYTTPTIIRVELDKSQSGINEIKQYANGSLLSRDYASDSDDNSNNFGNYTLYIGAFNNSASYFDGDFGELLIYPTVLSTGNAAAVEQYLGDKWGVSVVQ